MPPRQKGNPLTSEDRNRGIGMIDAGMSQRHVAQTWVCHKVSSPALGIAISLLVQPIDNMLGSMDDAVYMHTEEKDPKEHDSLLNKGHEESASRTIEKQLLIKPALSTGWGLSCRVVLAIVAFFGFTINYALRVNMSVAIVAMVKHHNKTIENDDECLVFNTTVNPRTSKYEPTGEFDWSPNLQGTILGAFFYGYVCTCFPGGYIAERYGAKWIFGGAILLTSIFTLLTPVAARWSSGLLIALRVFQGLFEGVTFPTMHALWAVWAPTLERSKLMSFTYAGAHLGTVISLAISGLLASSSFLGGWPSIFYVFGTLGCIWCIFWCFLVYDSPAKHPRISKEERRYIEMSIGPKKRAANVPWRSIVTSMPVWAIIVTHFCKAFGFVTMLTNLPMYLSHILHFDLTQNGVLSAVPYMGVFLISIIAGIVADNVRSHQYLSTTHTRKIFVAMGLGLPAIFLFCIGYAGCNIPLALMLVVLSVATLGLSYPGFFVNHVDIAPLYAGTLLGISNTVASVTGFVGPQIVGILTNKHETRAQWQYVFIIAASMNIFAILFYTVFGQGEQQSWAKESEDTKS